MEHYIQTTVHEEDREKLRQFACASYLVQGLANADVQHVNYRAVIDGEILYYQLKAVRAGKWEKQQGIVLGFRSVDVEIRRKWNKKACWKTRFCRQTGQARRKACFYRICRMISARR